MTYDAAEDRYDTDATGMHYRFTGRSGLKLPALSRWACGRTSAPTGPRRPSAPSCAGPSTAA